VGIHSFEVQEERMRTLTVPIPLWEPEIPIPWGEKVTEIIPLSEKVNSRVFIPGAINFCAMGFFVAGFATMVSAWDRYRWRTLGIVVGFVVVQTIVKIIGMSADRFAWLKYLSIFTAYEPEQAVAIATEASQYSLGLSQWFGPSGYNLVFLLSGCLCYFLAIAIFSRRDFPAPL